MDFFNQKIDYSSESLFFNIAVKVSQVEYIGR